MAVRFRDRYLGVQERKPQPKVAPGPNRKRKCAPRSGWMDHLNLGKSPALWAIFKAENTTAPRG
jgi:hypothetical protein